MNLARYHWGGALDQFGPESPARYRASETSLKIISVFEYSLDQRLNTFNSELFDDEVDLSGFKTDVDRISQRNPLFEMGPTHLAFRHILLPPDHPLIVEFLVQLEWKMKVDPFADLQSNQSRFWRNDQAYSAGTDVPQKISKSRPAIFPGTQERSRPQINGYPRLRPAPVLGWLFRVIHDFSINISWASVGIPWTTPI